MINLVHKISLIILTILVLSPSNINGSPTIVPICYAGTTDPPTFGGGDSPLENAQAPFNPDKTSYANLGDYIKELYIYSIWLISAISIVMIVWGGYQIIMSSGSPEGVQKGRSTIISALVSLAILALAYILLQIISPSIIKPTAPPKGNIQAISSNKVLPRSYASQSGQNGGQGTSISDSINDFVNNLPLGWNTPNLQELIAQLLKSLDIPDFPNIPNIPNIPDIPDIPSF